MITKADLEAVRQPVDRARGLPNAAYVSADIFEQERSTVFFKSWAGIGFAKDIPQPGDARPILFAGQPLLAVRDGDGAVRVFQNTCRHRGMILVDRPVRLRGAIRCPYHSWSYGLDGALKATPHVGGPGVNRHPDLDRDALGLVEFPSRVWRDVIFVNMAGGPEDFDESTAVLIDRWKDLDRPLFHGGADSSFSLEVATNWKLAVENYCESSHLPWVHPGLNSYSRLEDHYNIAVPGRFSGQGTRVYRPGLGEDGLGFADFPELPEIWDTAAEYIALYPNVLFGVHRDHAYAIVLEPAAPDRTIEHVEIYYASDEMRSDAFAELRAANARLWQGVFREDVGVVEGMQRGRHGAAFDGGRFSPVMDAPTHCFHRWVAEKYAGG